MFSRYFIASVRTRGAGIRAAMAGLALLAAQPGAWAHGSHDERIAAITAKLAENPTDPALHFDLARTNLEHGDWQIALLNLERVEQLAPGEFFTDLLAAQCWLRGDKPAKVKPAIDRFIAAHPEIGSGWLCRARTLVKLGEPGRSLADYREALQRTPNPEPDLVHEVAEVLARQGEKSEALQVLTAGIEKFGPAPGLVLMALELEIATDRFDAALSRIDATQQAAPRPEPWMAKRAAVLDQAGRGGEARQAWIALIDHLAALPGAERGSHAMSRLAEQARNALLTLHPEQPASLQVP